MSDGPVRRRDLLTTAAFSAAGVGGLFALWPFVAALNPAADLVARRIALNIDPLEPGQAVTIEVGSEPVLVMKRTAAQISWLQNPTLDAYRDRDSGEEVWQPTWAVNWHRSSKPEIMVCVLRCTFDPWVVVGRPGVPNADLMMCPHCGSRYDLAGRVISGWPAKHNLFVPPHHYLDDRTIEFNEAEFTQSLQRAMQTLRASPA